jgi:hypothetical protein
LARDYLDHLTGLEQLLDTKLGQGSESMGGPTFKVRSLSEFKTILCFFFRL